MHHDAFKQRSHRGGDSAANFDVAAPPGLSEEGWAYDGGALALTGTTRAEGTAAHAWKGGGASGQDGLGWGGGGTFTVTAWPAPATSNGETKRERESWFLQANLPCCTWRFRNKEQQQRRRSARPMTAGGQAGWLH